MNEWKNEQTSERNELRYTLKREDATECAALLACINLHTPAEHNYLNTAKWVFIVYRLLHLSRMQTMPN